MNTEIYANLNKGGISIRQNGKVQAVVAYAELTNVSFIVNRSGYERTIREQQRNVHAFARGSLQQVSEQVNSDTIEFLRSKYLRISYNPFRCEYFTCNGANIRCASKVIMVLTERKNERNRPLCELFLVE